MRIRAQVGIVGAGPAGLLAANVLTDAGLDCVVLERGSRGWVRDGDLAGTLEHRVVRLLSELGLARGLFRDGTVDDALEFRTARKRFRIQYGAIKPGLSHYIYPGNRLLRDLTEAYVSRSGRIHYRTATYTVTGLNTPRPTIAALGTNGHLHIDCDFVLGCDGAQATSRRSFPEHALRRYETRDPYAWLAIIAEAPTPNSCVITGLSEHGAAVYIRRKAAMSRFYLQCHAGDRLSDWPEERIWSQLRARLATAADPVRCGGQLHSTALVRLRSVVCAPMRHGRLLLLGDAAHVFPAVGSKGMNLALEDAFELSLALIDWFKRGNEGGLRSYCDRRLRHARCTQEFVHWLTGLVNLPSLGTADAAFLHRLQAARLERVLTGGTSATAFLADYVGLW